ncbi:MarR Transcriptional regulators [Rhabdaerophilaceae bacterium]
MTSKNDPFFVLLNEIGIISQLAQSAFERVMPAGMTMAQFIVLNHFHRLGIAAKAPAELARAFQLTKATMTSTLHRMERKGLLEIMPDPGDGRAKRVSVTQMGQAMHQACLEALSPKLAEWRDLLTDIPIDEVLPTLVRLRTTIDKARA